MPRIDLVTGPDGKAREVDAEVLESERRAAAGRAKAEAALTAALDLAAQRRLAAQVAEVSRLAQETAAARALADCRERLIAQGLDLSPEATLEEITAAAMAAIETRAASGAKGRIFI